jgi:hypothetical protein
MRYISLLPVCAALVLPSLVSAASLNYGDKVGADIIYRQVSEDSVTDPVPLYGNPAISGNALLFTPVNFGAFASNGSLDITDSTLSTSIEAKPNKRIKQIAFAEAGDYTLVGGGTAATSAIVRAPYFVRVVEVDGAPITPLLYTSSLTFTPSNGDYFLPTDAGAGVTFVGSTLIDIDAILAGAGIQGEATKVLFSMNNQLIATSEQGTISFIKKKTADGVTITTVVPEPASLTAVGALTLLVRRRR